MKKFAKLSAVIAAMVIALAFAGCSSDDDDDDDDGGGMQAVTEVDTSKLAAGTYSYTETSKDISGSQSVTTTEKGTVTITGVSDKSTVSMTKQSEVIKCSDKDAFDSEKADCEEADMYIFDDSALTIRLKAAEEPESWRFSEFKEDYLTFPEDKNDSEEGYSYTKTYTDKSLRMADDGSKIVLSYKSSWTETENDETESGNEEYEFVLERQ